MALLHWGTQFLAESGLTAIFSFFLIFGCGFQNRSVFLYHTKFLSIPCRTLVVLHTPHHTASVVTSQTSRRLAVDESTRNQRVSLTAANQWDFAHPEGELRRKNLTCSGKKIDSKLGISTPILVLISINV